MSGMQFCKGAFCVIAGIWQFLQFEKLNLENTLKILKMECLYSDTQWGVLYLTMK